MGPDVLVRLRVAHALTQHEAADRIGISRRQYARWEAGEATPGPRSIRAIARAYDVRVDELDSAPRDIGTILACIEDRLERIEALLERIAPPE